ncbi:hypothetical protein [Filimonas effusa]|uniref:Uncharacterized protein n=1 Tax=Filimonas effusa TaxID=2508721 RepID=A0A4Q1D7P2_9BACT|nr:hypothetical protein [Filimonas effusa]RXK85314.1 hypothetical protein ESB13_00365 [Filimonas effusa]
MQRVFPVNTPQEEELFSILKKAYCGARYDADFGVPMEAATVLYDRVGLLLKAGEAAYKKQISDWEAAVEKEATFPLSVAFVNTLMPAS